jgi:hypothetical protein
LASSARFGTSSTWQLVRLQYLRQNRRTIVPSCYHPVMVKQKHETGPVMTLGICPRFDAAQT